MKIITRAEAKAKGLKRYFTGKSCKHGHVAMRYSSSGGCLTCCDERYECTQESIARWRSKNPEKQAEYNRRYRAKKPEVMLTGQRRRNRDRYHKNPQLSHERVQKWRSQNMDRVREQQHRNREAARAASRRYKLEGPQNPKGEAGWLRKNKVLLRNLRRLLRHPHLDHSSWLKKALQP